MTDWRDVCVTSSLRCSAFYRLGLSRIAVSWPWLFAIGLTLSTSGFILLGGLGQRYATIAFGALLIAIYTMLGTSLYEHWYQQPIYLLAGAVWYNVLTLIGHLLFPVRPLQDNLARCYEQLARYLELKSRMFDPDIEDESQAPLYDLALANGQLMATLNQTKLAADPLTWRSWSTGNASHAALLLCRAGYSRACQLFSYSVSNIA